MYVTKLCKRLFNGGNFVFKSGVVSMIQDSGTLGIVADALLEAGISVFRFDFSGNGYVFATSPHAGYICLVTSLDDRCLPRFNAAQYAPAFTGTAVALGSGRGDRRIRN